MWRICYELATLSTFSQDSKEYHNMIVRANSKQSSWANECIYFQWEVQDTFLRYTTIYMIKQKSEVLAKFRKFSNPVENRNGLKIKRLSLENQSVKHLRSHNGDEYVLTYFEDFCNSRRIEHEPTILTLHYRTE